jgi:lactocepin
MMTVKDANGNIMDWMEVKNEHTVQTKWVPEDLPNGTYYISFEATTKDGFKVTSIPKAVTVLN